MQRAELFSYLSAFVTIVLAIAMSEMIQSTHRLIRSRHQIKWDALPLVFAAIVVLFVITEFFALWTRFNVAEVTMLRLLWLLATPTLFTLLAYSVLPDDVPAEGVDLTEFYWSQRKVWAVMYATAALFDLARSLEPVVFQGEPFARSEWAAGACAPFDRRCRGPCTCSLHSLRRPSGIRRRTRARRAESWDFRQRTSARSSSREEAR